VRTDGVEPPQHEAAALQAVELTNAQRPHEGDRPDSNRRLEVHDLGCCRYTTATMHGDDRARTGVLSPDKRALLPLSYVPEGARVGFEPTVSSS
jgi:hypothetical protein